MDLGSAIQYPIEFLSGAALDGAGLLILVLIFAAVVAGVIGGASIIGFRGQVQRRLAGNAGSVAPAGTSPVLTLRGDKNESRWNDLMNRLEKHLVPTAEDKLSALRLKLIQAGYMSQKGVSVYYAIRVALCITFPALFLFQATLLSRGMPVMQIMLIALALGYVGLYLPGLWLSRRASSRQRAVTNSFPDALDMLVVCVEAGLSLDSAFTRVGTQITSAHPVLATHFGLVSLELRAGKSREEALRNLADRVGVQELNSFVTLLIQSDLLGASIAQTLRVYSDEMRMKRMLLAEEKAHKLPVLLSVPLVVCILPALIASLLLPGIVMIVRTLIPALNG